MIDQVGAQGSYLSQHATGELSFGLGKAQQLDSVVVRWPDGSTDTGGPFAADSLVTWERGSAPQVEMLPGKIRAQAQEPESIEDKRRFVGIMRQASKQRIAGDLPAAESGYRQALDIWPGHWDCLYYLGNILVEQDREAEALPVFEKLVVHQPNASRGWMQIGKLHLPGGDPNLDDLAAARVAFSHCHRINSEESQPSVQLGVVSLLETDFDQADDHFAAAAAHNSRSVEARWFRGWIAFQRGDHQNAKLHLEAAYAIATDSGPGGSTSNEGDTTAGSAMTTLAGEFDPNSLLHRWRSLSNRSAEIQIEFGEIAAPSF